MRVISAVLIAILGLAPSAPLAEGRGSSNALIVDEAPNFVRPYVLPKFKGRSSLLTASQPIRFSITTNSSGGAFALVQHNGKASGWTQARYHAHRETSEYFYTARGRAQVWLEKNVTGAGQEARVGTVGDFAAAPSGTIHTFQLVDIDSQLTHIFQPGGFEHLFDVFTGGEYQSDVGAPYPPDPEDKQPFGPLTPEERAKLEALDLYPADEGLYVPRRDFINGTAGNDGGLNWHNGNNTLPEDPSDPFFVANNYGPKYLNKDNGYKVIQPLLASNENFTIGTVIMSEQLEDEPASKATLPHHFGLQMEEGQLALAVSGYPETLLLSGDVAFIPANTSFEYAATVPFTKFLYMNAGNRGLDHQLLESSIPWGFPAYPVSSGF